MIILDGNPNEQASIDNKIMEAEGQSELAPASPTTTIPPPPPYFSQPPPNTGLLAAQNNQTAVPGPPNSHQQSALKRFLKAFACALLVITLMRMLVWSVDLVSSPERRDPHEWTSIHNDALSKPEKLGCGGIVHSHCPPPQTVPDPPPRRILPIQYPPHASTDSRSKLA